MAKTKSEITERIMQEEKYFSMKVGGPFSR
jgi:hypothetical protein